MAEDMMGEIIKTLSEVLRDHTVPKNTKARIESIITILSEKTETSIKVNKALHELEEISEDTNLQAFTRTQIWNISSMLEKI